MARIRAGVDRLLELEETLLRGKRIGLLTNPTGLTADFRTTVEVCRELRHGKLTALFACEHGIRGERQAGVLFEDEVDPELGIPVYSLYGERKRPTAEILESVDTVLFDIQDLGVRFYTFLTTLIYTMEACEEAGKELVVLDRPNPLGGEGYEGGILEPGFESMVGCYTMPIRTGMTLGEFAGLVHGEKNWSFPLHVVPLEGWTRDMEFPETGLPWMLPSPNMPLMDTVRVYAGTCFFEGTNLSEGRGTTRPFEMLGAPWMDGREWSRRINALQLPGLQTVPVYFTPTFSKHSGDLCYGIRVFVTDPAAYRSVDVGLHLVHEAARLHPDRFEWLSPFAIGRKPFIDLLTGSELVRTSLTEDGGAEQIISLWKKDTDEWKRRREPYLRYGRN